jgi:dTDP-4-amino-4,6-dideoxygalactose transaminase
LAIFSFHPVKHIATGEGGMVTTNHNELKDRLEIFRTHGITKNPDLMQENHGGWYYEMLELGYNYRLSDIHAALGISQMTRIQENINRRRAIAERYNKAFENTTIHIPYVPESCYHVYHLYIIQTADRAGLYNHLRQHNIYPQVHYIPVHLLPYYRNLGWKKNDFPVAEAYYDRCLSLPMYPDLTDNQQQFVIDTVIKFTG